MEPILFLVCNKKDLSEERVVPYKDGKDKTLSIRAEFSEVSTKEKHRFRRAFNSVSKAYFERGPVVKDPPTNALK